MDVSNNRDRIRQLYLAGTKDITVLSRKTGLSRPTVYSYLRNWDAYIQDHIYYRVCQECGDRQLVNNKKNASVLRCAACARKAQKHIADPVTRTIVPKQYTDTQESCVHHYILDTAGNGACKLCGKQKYTIQV